MIYSGKCFFVIYSNCIAEGQETKHDIEIQSAPIPSILCNLGGWREMMDSGWGC